MYAVEQAKISILSEARDNVKADAQRERRNLTTEERKVISDIDDYINEIKMSLPVNGPLTLEKGMSNNETASRTSGRVYNSLGEQLQSIARAGIPGGETDHRLHQINNATGLGESIPSEGGFLVQTDFSAQLLKGVFETGLVAPRCNRFQISANSNGIKLPAIDETSRATGSRWGGVTSYWKAEAAEKTASKPKFRTMELNLHKLVGLCYASDELLQDSAALETVITQAFSDEINFALDDAIINGTGAGQPLGILNSGALVAVTKETGQKADTVVYENIIKMYSRMPARNRRNAVWFINQDVEPQLYQMSLAIGTGGSAVYLPGGGVSQAPYASLFGRPVVPIEQCATLGDQGDIIFADLSNYILIDKGGIQSAMSIHVKFIYDESVFRFVYRVDGQPALASPITPYKGTANTLSPFVTLAARA